MGRERRIAVEAPLKNLKKPWKSEKTSVESMKLPRNTRGACQRFVELLRGTTARELPGRNCFMGVNNETSWSGIVPQLNRSPAAERIHSDLGPSQPSEWHSDLKSNEKRTGGRRGFSAWVRVSGRGERQVFSLLWYVRGIRVDSMGFQWDFHGTFLRHPHGRFLVPVNMKRRIAHGTFPEIPWNFCVP